MITEKDNVFYCDCGFSFERGRSGNHECGDGLRRKLESFRTAFMEYSEKTDWMQADKRFDVIKPWGKHRADVLKLYIDHLESKLEAAEKRIAELNQHNYALTAKIEPMDRRIAELEEDITDDVHDEIIELLKSGDLEVICFKSEHEDAERIRMMLYKWRSTYFDTNAGVRNSA